MVPKLTIDAPKVEAIRRIVKTDIKIWNWANMSVPPTVTVIIPSFRDWERLGSCLAALSKQSYPRECFDIIVINNDPDDKAPDGFALPGNATLICEARPGSYAARNAGLQLARGTIIGFTDSDCIPHTDWIKNAVDYLGRHPDCSRVAGKVKLFFKSTKLTIAELYESMFAFNQQRYVKSGTSITANLFTYREVFSRLGYFDNELLSGGDYAWGKTAQNAGYRVQYVEDVVVDHPARQNLAQLISKEKRVGGGQSKFLDTDLSNIGLFLKFFRMLLPKAHELHYIIENGKSISLLNKIRLFFVRHILLAVREWEKIRVRAGKAPRRK